MIDLTANDLLLIIDLQVDFCPGGRLAIADGDSVVPAINLLATRFDHIVLTQDWHTPSHSSFASSHPHATPYETIAVSYGDQTLWPDHCIQNTPGAEFHPDLDPGLVLARTELILRKGFRRDIDSYSAFVENDKRTFTGLAGYLRERGFKRLFLAGLAYDFCVRFSAVDAVAAGFEAFVIADACRPVKLQGSVAATDEEFAVKGVHRISVADLLTTDLPALP